LSLSEIVAQLSDLGIGQTAVRYAARAAAQDETAEQYAVLRWAFRLRMILVLGLTALAAWFTPFLAEQIWHIPNFAPLLRLGLVGGMLTAVAAVPILYFRSIKRFGMNAFVTTSQILVMFLGVLLLAWWDLWTVRWVIWVSLIASSLAALIFLILVPRQALFVWEDVRSFVQRGAPWLWTNPASSDNAASSLDDTSPNQFALLMFVSMLLLMVTAKADIWLLGAFLDESYVGIYNAAFRLALPLSIVLVAIDNVVLPKASAVTELQGTKRLLTKTLRATLLLGGCGLVYAIIIPPLTPLLFGAEYQASVAPGRLLCLAYVIITVVSPLGIIGYNLGMVRVSWVTNLLRMVVSIGTLILLVPTWGALGAAWAFLANATVLAVMNSLILWRRLQMANTGSTQT
jgi:PST family polysaccharide transporter